MTGTEEKVAMRASAGQRPHAEIRQVWPRDGNVRVLGTVVIGQTADDVPVDKSWTLRLTSRERPETEVPTGVKRFTSRLRHAVNRTSPPTPRQLHFPVVNDGARFEAVVPVSALAVWDALPSEHWDLHVVATRRGKELVLRVGRHNDDMPGKKQIVKFPEQYEAGVGVLPYYTDRDDLSIRCARRDDANRSAT